MKNKKIYEGPYSTVKKVEKEGKVLVKKKFRYAKYRGKEEIEEIHKKC